MFNVYDDKDSSVRIRAGATNDNDTPHLKVHITSNIYLLNLSIS